MYIQYVCRYGIGCPNLVCSLYIFQRKLIGQSQLAGDACPACRAQPELPSIILLLIEVPKLGNKEIHTYIEYQLGPGLGSISDFIFTEVGRVPRNERLVYTKCSVSQKLRARENSEFRYQKVTREGTFKITIHSLLNKI